jgi:hypothetical protein
MQIQNSRFYRNAVLGSLLRFTALQRGEFVETSTRDGARRGMPMESNLESESSPETSHREHRQGSWLKVAALAGASALAGGLAAAWFYRKTLTRLQDANSETHGPEPRPWMDEDGDGI